MIQDKAQRHGLGFGPVQRHTIRRLLPRGQTGQIPRPRAQRVLRRAAPVPIFEHLNRIGGQIGIGQGGGAQPHP